MENGFKIASFQKDHDRLQPGFYFSTLQKGVATFDLRFKKPNAGDFLAQAALHSIEHMLATALRAGPSLRISSISGRWAAVRGSTC